MNFLDTYEITGTGTSTPPQPNPSEQSLNEEVTQVIGQLGRFWGGFRKQSQTALESARKDLGDVVTKLTAEQPLNSTGRSLTGDENESGPQNEAQAGPSSEGDRTPSTSTNEQDSSTSPSQSLFTRLSSSLPPNIVSAVQTHLPDSLRNASQNIDFAQLRTNLSTEFQRVQGVTRAQAEEYVHRSEGLLKDAMREAGEVLRDAVKVIPPEEGGPVPDAIWDGTDVWMLPSSSDSTITDAKGKGKQVDLGPLGEGHHSVATRAESLLKQLKYDPAVIRADPEADEGVRKLYLSWIEAEINSKEGGLDNKECTDKITNALGELRDGEALQSTHDALVPSEMTNEKFWKRYLFRVYQVEKEEEKRKALLQGTIDADDEFSWEDDEEDVTASASLSKNPRSMNDSTSSEHTLGIASKPGRPTKKASAPSSQVPTSATTSPRLSSEDSYDLVSSENVGTAGEKGRTKKGGDDDPDSDWE